VVLVKERFARDFCGADDPIGQRLTMDTVSNSATPTSRWRTIVGVVGDEKLLGPAVPAPLQIYEPMAQNVEAPALPPHSSPLASSRACCSPSRPHHAASKSAIEARLLEVLAEVLGCRRIPVGFSVLGGGREDFCTQLGMCCPFAVSF
jgi:hypothetical protein